MKEKHTVVVIDGQVINVKMTPKLARQLRERARRPVVVGQVSEVHRP